MHRVVRGRDVLKRSLYIRGYAAFGSYFKTLKSIIPHSDSDR